MARLVTMSSYETLGGLRNVLRACDLDAFVYIDNRPPTALSSYRGYYRDLAIECTETRHKRTELSGRGGSFEDYSPGHSEVRIKAEPRVADLIEALDLADGEVFEGYKGGQFTMDTDTKLWVSEWGGVSSLRIVTVENLPGRVDFMTRRKGYWW